MPTVVDLNILPRNMVLATAERRSWAGIEVLGKARRKGHPEVTSVTRLLCALFARYSTCWILHSTDELLASAYVITQQYAVAIGNALIKKLPVYLVSRALDAPLTETTSWRLRDQIINVSSSRLGASYPYLPLSSSFH
jgi:hypothetical protein